MTRSEAISLIKSAQLMLINPTTNEPVSDLYMALYMAISALEQNESAEEWYKLFVEKLDEQEQTDTWNIKDVADTFKKHGLIREQEPCSVLDEIQVDIYEHFMTIDGGVHDKSALKCMEIIDKYKASEEISERNMKMWEEIFKAESEDKECTKKI